MTWGQMIEALQSERITLENIAEELQISVRMVCYLKAYPQTQPRYEVGHRLILLYSKHCSSNVQSIS